MVPFPGQRDTRQIDTTNRAVIGARNSLGSMWNTLGALQVAGVTPADPSWPLLQGLDIATAADVLSTLEVGYAIVGLPQYRQPPFVEKPGGVAWFGRLGHQLSHIAADCSVCMRCS